MKFHGPEKLTMFLTPQMLPDLLNIIRAFSFDLRCFNFFHGINSAKLVDWNVIILQSCAILQWTCCWNLLGQRVNSVEVEMTLNLQKLQQQLHPKGQHDAGRWDLSTNPLESDFFWNICFYMQWFYCHETDNNFKIYNNL